MSHTDLQSNGFMTFRNIKGQSDEEHHKNWFPIESCSFSHSNELYHSHTKNDHPGDFSTINIVRNFDYASSQILGAISNKDVGECKIHFSKINGDYKNPLVELKLENAQIISYNTELTIKGMVEHISIHFTRIEIHYIPYGEDNDKMSKAIYGWQMPS
jgi:type VI protein secretion system component Hcp